MTTILYSANSPFHRRSGYARKKPRYIPSVQVLTYCDDDGYAIPIEECHKLRSTELTHDKEEISCWVVRNDCNCCGEMQSLEFASTNRAEADAYKKQRDDAEQHWCTTNPRKELGLIIDGCFYILKKLYRKPVVESFDNDTPPPAKTIISFD